MISINPELINIENTTMKHIDLTVRTDDENVALFHGKPSEHGLDTAKYLLLTGDTMEARVWLVGVINAVEKQKIIQGVMGYLEMSMRVAEPSAKKSLAL